jgi:hypothetical protein
VYELEQKFLRYGYKSKLQKAGRGKESDGNHAGGDARQRFRAERQRLPRGEFLSLTIPSSRLWRAYNLSSESEREVSFYNSLLAGDLS